MKTESSTCNMWQALLNSQPLTAIAQTTQKAEARTDTCQIIPGDVVLIRPHSIVLPDWMRIRGCQYIPVPHQHCNKTGTVLQVLTIPGMATIRIEGVPTPSLTAVALTALEVLIKGDE